MMSQSILLFYHLFDAVFRYIEIGTQGAERKEKGRPGGAALAVVRPLEFLGFWFAGLSSGLGGNGLNCLFRGRAIEERGGRALLALDRGFGLLGGE